MNKTQKIILAIFGVVTLAFIYAEATHTPPLDWSPDFTSKSVKPYGSKAFHSLLENSQFKTQKTYRSPYELIQHQEIDAGTYLFFNDQLAFDQESVKKLLDWVHEGNDVFISAININSSLLDSLQLQHRSLTLNYQATYKSKLQLKNPAFNEKTFTTENKPIQYYFSKIDTIKHLNLGEVSPIIKDGKPKDEEFTGINFVEVKHGDGKFWIHLFPQAFSNHFTVFSKNHLYTDQILQYIDQEKTLFVDQYYKSGKKVISSPLNYIASEKSLRWAYLFLVLTGILYILFEGKRKQRPIPVVKPLANKTYEFARTIAGLYAEKNNHKQIAEKQIQLLKAYIREKYSLQTNQIDRYFYRDLASKSGTDYSEIESLFIYIKKIQAKDTLSKEELLALNDKISQLKA
ncbi:MAG: DUF4350 domain-containing protein [Bacteroidota bacterium]